MLRVFICDELHEANRALAALVINPGRPAVCGIALVGAKFAAFLCGVLAAAPHADMLNFFMHDASTMLGVVFFVQLDTLCAAVPLCRLMAYSFDDGSRVGNALWLSSVQGLMV